MFIKQCKEKNFRIGLRNVNVVKASGVRMVGGNVYLYSSEVQNDKDNLEVEKDENVALN